jgi:Protein of unknown function (DUF3667)
VRRESSGAFCADAISICTLMHLTRTRSETLYMNDSAIACRNCAAALAPGQKFCGACGQRADLQPRLTMREISHDIVHAITHADHSIFALIRGLVRRPGHVAREYISGQRKRHFGPWAFLLITVGLASAVILMTGVQWFSPYSQSPAADFLQRHINFVILLQMPLLAAFCALLFWRERLSYAEHLVLAAYASGFRQLYLALIETPLLALTAANTADPRLQIVYYGVWFGYFAFAASQFYRGNRFWTVCKAVAAAALAQLATILLVAGLLALMGGFARQ